MRLVRIVWVGWRASLYTCAVHEQVSGDRHRAMFEQVNVIIDRRDGTGAYIRAQCHIQVDLRSTAAVPAVTTPYMRKPAEPARACAFVSVSLDCLTLPQRVGR